MLRIFIFLVLSLTIADCQHSSENEGNTENIKKGQALFTHYGCFTCHSLEGKKMYGPALNNVLGKRIEVIRNEKVVNIIISRKYLTRSILNPDYEKVKEFYRQKMPVPAISKSEADFLVDYIIKVNKEKKQ